VPTPQARNQFERLVERILGLGVEGTEIVKTGTWYKLPLLHNTVLCPVCTEVDGTEPPSHWPQNRELSGLVEEIVAATSPSTKLWVADPLPDLEAPELVLRPYLAEQRRPVITKAAEAMDDIFAGDQEGDATEDQEEGDTVA
jgi:hypothetical protein